MEKTYCRAANLPSMYQQDGKKILTVTNRNYWFMSRDKLEKASCNSTFFLEFCRSSIVLHIALVALILILVFDYLILDEVAILMR